MDRLKITESVFLVGDQRMANNVQKGRKGISKGSVKNSEGKKKDDEDLFGI